jgi:CheY-like chemotaxis protein
MEEHKKMKLLLVDDDQFLLTMYSLKFGKSGFEVTTSPSSQDALSKLRGGFVPDVILLDIIMPGMDGLELLEAVRKEKLAEASVVVMLTNQGDEMERAKSLGVKGYIVKATTVPSEVVEEVKRIAKENKGN